MKKPIFKAGQRYTFKDYFDLPHPVEEIIAELGYSYQRAVLDLPRATKSNLNLLNLLKQNYYKVIPKITLNSESAKREFLIAPLLFEVAKETDSRISVEYPIEVDDRLSGYLDYLIRADQQIVLIEAKKGDIDRGFNQLAAELIALDKYDSDGADTLYGAVTIGEMWVFSTLHRSSQRVTRDLHSFTIPEDVTELFRILVGIIEAE